MLFRQEVEDSDDLALIGKTKQLEITTSTNSRVNDVATG